MLRLDIGSLPEGLSHVDLTAETSEWGDPLEGGRLEGRVKVGLDVTKAGHDVFVKGRATVEAVLECARCLEEYTCNLETPIELWVVIGGAKGGGAAEERENVIDVQARAKYADLTDHVRSELLVQVPLKQLCKADCRGLCPECGTNLNAARCGCRIESHDSRWEDLKKMKNNA
jgi:uncharacterized protein